MSAHPEGRTPPPEQSITGSVDWVSVADDVRWLLDVGFWRDDHLSGCAANRGGPCECRLGMIRTRYEWPVRATSIRKEATDAAP